MGSSGTGTVVVDGTGGLGSSILSLEGGSAGFVMGADGGNGTITVSNGAQFFTLTGVVGAGDTSGGSYPGGIGTLDEAVEMLSWARLGLHAKPMAFLDEDGFWAPFFELMDHIIDGKFTPEVFRAALVHEQTPEAAIQALCDRVVKLGDM